MARWANVVRKYDRSGAAFRLDAPSPRAFRQPPALPIDSHRWTSAALSTLRHSARLCRHRAYVGWKTAKPFPRATFSPPRCLLPSAAPSGRLQPTNPITEPPRWAKAHPTRLPTHRACVGWKTAKPFPRVTFRPPRCIACAEQSFPRLRARYITKRRLPSILRSPTQTFAPGTPAITLPKR